MQQQRYMMMLIVLDRDTCSNRSGWNARNNGSALATTACRLRPLVPEIGEHARTCQPSPFECLHRDAMWPSECHSV